MSNDNVLELKKPVVSNAVCDALTEVLRDGARTLVAQAVEAEVTEFLARHQADQDAAGRTRMVRNGHLPERTIQTGLGQVAVKAPRVHDRAAHPLQGARIGQDPGVPDQQYGVARTDYRRAPQESLAGRVVFKMDQAASVDQALLWHHGERRQDANLDGRRRLTCWWTS